ncbi:hypothetical protein DFP72DRAFT_1105882 [Ephemerocybe angulata]|uniref:DUF6533 domain-containing protein n=1 Tax=Ephemerocybe angulata TaxID=980116 RepID=A0A8H6LU97_9AGAR|nr:hypothetical protein DFP72DRAFT_1105882 [Tulosesus angulatus]
MDLTPEDLEMITQGFSNSTNVEYIFLAYYVTYIYYYLTTLTEEMSVIWPQKLKTGKILFLLTRYSPLLLIAIRLPVDYRTFSVLPHQICTGLYLASDGAISKVIIVSAEIALLLCLHALLGARRRYLALFIAIYTGLTLGAYIPGYQIVIQASHTSPISELDEALGYPCTWDEDISQSARNALVAAGYVSLTKVVLLAALALAIFAMRYRGQSNSLIYVIRRDSGAYIFSLTAIRFGGAIVSALRSRYAYSNIPDATFSGLVSMIVPILASRLLINMRKTKEPVALSIISTLLFDPPQDSSDSSEDEFDDPVAEMVQYQGLGRKKASGRMVSETRPTQTGVATSEV